MRCNIGDRAFIIKSRFPENIGKIVKVVGKGFLFDWLVESQGSKIKCSTHIFTGECIGYGSSAKVEAHDSDLMPIRGEPEKESEREKEVA